MDDAHAPPPATIDSEHETGREESQPQAFRFEFTASAGEYFRVWIVNVALTIVTLGIYSAWAKVRNRQYFYGNARLAGASFQYTANPVSILKGRILVVAVLLAYNAAAAFQPLLAGVLVLALVPLFPWLVVTAVRFNHRHSAYRNLRFHFDGAYAESFRIYVLWTLAIIASLGLAYPFAVWRRKRFLVERSRFGNGAFSYQAEIGFFYVVYILAGVLYAGALTALGVLMGAAIALIGPDAAERLSDAPPGDAAGGIALLALMVVVYGGIFAAFVVVNTGVQAAISNYVWSNTRLEGIRFKLAINVFKIVVIQLTNVLAIIASVGLLTPWAKVRITRYRLSCFGMLAAPADIERFVATQRERVTATGEEFGEALDLDLGL